MIMANLENQPILIVFTQGDGDFGGGFFARG